MKCLSLIFTFTLCFISYGAFAAQPTNINYAGKGSTFGGENYRLYAVRCSNGKKNMITKWNSRSYDQWCVGKASEKRCSSSQLKAAQHTCR